MTNYIPSDLNDRYDLEKDNILYKEIFDRRATGGCDECEDISNKSLCQSCAHNPDTDIRELPFREISVKRLRKAKTIKDRPAIVKKIMGIGTCPLCDNKNVTWTKVLVAYISDNEGNLKLGELNATYCPMCGKEVK